MPINYAIRVHHGWSEKNEPFRQAGDPVGYRQEWQLASEPLFKPIREADKLQSSGAEESRVLERIELPAVLLVNNSSALALKPQIAALQMRKSLAVLWEKTGEILPDAVGIQYSKGIKVSLNLKRFISGSKELSFRPAIVTDRPLKLEELPDLAQRALAIDGKQEVRPVDLSMTFSEAAQLTADPNREQRLLGLFKIWNVIRYFFPHLEFASIEWESILPSWIEKVEEAQSLSAYYTVLQELTARLNDSHIRIGHPSLPGDFTFPVKLRKVEGQVIVTEILPDGHAPSDLHVGDEITAIDGTPIDQFEEYWRSRIAASTEGALYRDIYRTDDRFQRGLPLLGDKGSVLRLTLRRSDLTVSLTRSVRPEDWTKARATGQHFQLMDGNLGYLNVAAVSTHRELYEAMRALRDKEGIILDIRGYPKVPAHVLLHFLQSKMVSGIFETPVVSALARPGYYPREAGYRGWFKWQTQSSPSPPFRYEGPVFVLIDENTQSSPEDFCIYLRAASRATFVGSHTAGTDGSITHIKLPGGGRMIFTGQRVRYADYSRFQNIGIVPDIAVKPTIAGIRKGEDEVLQTATAALRDMIESGE